jgi:uncharacterized LabA/DUF88 family protein
MISTKYKPELGDLVLYSETAVNIHTLGMIINIYKEDTEGIGQETLYRIEWYDSEDEGLGDYGYSFVQTDKYRSNYIEYRTKNEL